MRGRRHRWLPTHLVSALHRSRPETGKYSALRKLQSRWQALPVVVKNLENGAPPPSWFDPQPSAYLAVPDGSFQRKSHVRKERRGGLPRLDNLVHLHLDHAASIAHKDRQRLLRFYTSAHRLEPVPDPGRAKELIPGFVDRNWKFDLRIRPHTAPGPAP